MKGEKINLLRMTAVIAVFLTFAGCDLLTPGLGSKVDLDVPTIDGVTGIASGDYIRGTKTLSGTFNDDIGVTAVRISIDGTNYADATINLAAKTWTYTFDTTTYPDGEKNMLILVVDGSGKDTTKQLLAYIDNTAPLVLVKLPAGLGVPGQSGYSSWEDVDLNGDIDIKGEATDQYGIVSVKVSLYGDPNGSPAAIITAEGTNSWSYAFPSVDYVATVGDYYFRIVATDKAGNQSVSFLHNDDIYANEGESVSIENLYKILRGETVSGIDLNQAALESIMQPQDYLKLPFDQLADLPQFTFLTPSVTSFIDGEVMNGSARTIGMISDDAEGIDPSTVKVLINGDGTEDYDDPAWVPVTNTSGSNLLLTWKYDLPALVENVYTIRIQATDLGGAKNRSAIISFSVDNAAPTVEVTTPAQGEYINANFTISGTAFDGQAMTDADPVWVNVNDTVYEQADTFISTGGSYNYAWTYNVDISGVPDGPLPIKVRSTDDSGKSAYFNIQYFKDTAVPNIVYLSPAAGTAVNGRVTVKGTASDTNSLWIVQMRIGKPEDWIYMDNMYNWEYSFDSLSFANSFYADEETVDSNIWLLNVSVRAFDVAGNIRTRSDYVLKINADLDKPATTIMSPSSGATIGGPSLITGTAFDDDQLYDVQMQIDFNTNATWSNADWIDTYDLNGDGFTDDEFEDESQWYSISSANVWSKQINNSGEFYAAGAGDGHIVVRVRARDTKDGGLTNDVDGDYQQINLFFDQTLPRFENANLITNDYVKGLFTLTADVKDNTAISSVAVSYNNGTSYLDITNSASINKNSNLNDWDLSLTVNSTSYIPTSGLLYMKIRVVDNANYTTIQPITLNVDNQYPTGAYPLDASDLHETLGTDTRVQGTAADSGSVAGIDRIEVYFMRGANVYSLDSGLPDTPGTTDFGDGSGAVSYPTSAEYKINIDDHNEFGNDGGGNGDGDFFNESITIAGSTYNWWAEFDSDVLTDGAIDIHYVVFDNANNGAHYVKSGFIANHRPSISLVTVGTDLNDNANTSDTGERLDYPGANLFTARNDMLHVAITATSGNAPLTYALFHSSDTLRTNDLITSGNSADVNTSALSEASNSFVCVVTDNVLLSTETTISVLIDNVDTVASNITMDVLTQSNVKTSGSNKLGHLEEAGTSIDADGQADVSGNIIFSGTATDNNRIQFIHLTINGTGTNVLAAQWSGGTLTAVASGFTIVSQSLTTSGHTVNWTYDWNSATVTAAVRPNVDVSFSSTDFGTQPADTDLMTVDVYPYIKTVSTNTNGIKDGNIRSSTGKYSVKSGSTSNYIVVTGFNLNVNAAWVSTDPATPTAGDQLSITTAAVDPWTTVSLMNDGDRSGYLTLRTSGGTATINNINSNGYARNQEPDSVSKNNQLNDDRYISFYSVTDTTYTNGIYPVMNMEGNNPVFGYLNLSAANDLQVRRARVTGTAYNYPLIRTLYADQMAMAVDSSGMYYQFSVHNGASGNMFMIYNRYAEIHTAGAPYATNAGAASPYWSDYGPAGGNQYGTANNNAITLEGMNYGAGYLANRYKNLRAIAKGASNTAGTQASIYLMYYDANVPGIIFRSFQVGQNGQTNNLYNNTWATDGINYNNIRSNITDGNTQRSTAVSGGSQYFDFGLTDDNRAVVVYYDEAVGELRLIYSTTAQTGAAPGTAPTWTQNVSVDSSYIGSYVSVYIEPNATGNDPIHIAAYDSENGDLMYIYLNDGYADATPELIRVDAYKSIGFWTNIKLDSNGKPVIAYYSSSENGTKDSIKLARYLGSMTTVTQGVDLVTGYVTGNWEVLTVPTNSAPQGGDGKFRQVNLGFNTAGIPVVGYLGNDIEYAVYLPEI